MFALGYRLTYVVLAALLIIQSLYAGTVSAQELYRWVDDKGSVHFTDNFPSIPEKYREKAEKRSLVAPRTSPIPAQQTTQSQSSSRSQVFTVPFTRSGNHMIVEGVVNGRGTVKFILDTGASGTWIPKARAQESGIDPSRGILVPRGGVGGAVEAPLVEIESLNVGGATATNMEVVVQDLPFSKELGLLGMDFLADFRMVINQQRNEITLEYEPSEYGGHSLKWWQQRFKYYRNLKKHIDQTHSKSSSQPTSDLAEKQRRAIEEKLNDLEIRASRAGIPREFRE